MSGTVCYIGNYEPPHSTENEVRKAFLDHGWRVVTVQEDQATAEWDVVRKHALDADLLLYTPTQGLPQLPLLDLYDECGAAGVPTATFHLDLFYGLDSPKGATGINRRHWPAQHPMFRAGHVFTADGGHQADFARDGVNHHWLPPAVSAAECTPGTRRPQYEAPVTFVGSWQGNYHPESPHRAELVAWLQRTYGERVRFWPAPDQPALRGPELRDLYASTAVVVGDSCMVGTGMTHYCSDRVPETLGRGGFLLHPHVEGVFPQLWEAGVHLDTWPAGDWQALADKVDAWLGDPVHRTAVAEAGRAHTLAHHTYTHRVQAMLEQMELA